ncbi:DEKNAAC101777 [Brettanomyces naardenensis]|uniref:DEKNAAC101777 n=1 Tax=Brettanomyces naardenensis TaxID=13370 RepID=A0A448YJ28_BRENA|nr:DEKNAAC101777 [Brettanomyces naardenensis]
MASKAEHIESIAEENEEEDRTNTAISSMPHISERFLVSDDSLATAYYDAKSSSVATFRSAETISTSTANEPVSTIAAEQPDLISLGSTIKSPFGTPSSAHSPSHLSTARQQPLSPLVGRSPQRVAVSQPDTGYDNLYEQFQSPTRQISPKVKRATVKEGDLMTPSLFSPALVFNEPVQSLELLHPDKTMSRGVSERSIHKIGYNVDGDTSFDFNYDEDNEDAIKNYEKLYRLHFSSYNDNPIPNDLGSAVEGDADDTGDTSVDDPGLKFVKRHDKKLSIRLVQQEHESIKGDSATFEMDATDITDTADSVDARNPSGSTLVTEESPLVNGSSVRLQEMKVSPSLSLLPSPPTISKSPVLHDDSSKVSSPVSSPAQTFDQTKCLPKTPESDSKSKNKRLTFKGMFRRPSITGLEKTSKPTLEPLKKLPPQVKASPALSSNSTNSRKSDRLQKAKSFAGYSHLTEPKKDSKPEKKERRKSLFAEWRKSFSFVQSKSGEGSSKGSFFRRKKETKSKPVEKKPAVSGMGEKPVPTIKTPATPQTPQSFVSYQSRDGFDPFAESAEYPLNGLGISLKNQTTLSSPKSQDLSFVPGSLASNAHVGDSIFPKYLDTAEIESIASMERSRSLGSVGSAARSVRSGTKSPMGTNSIDRSSIVRMVNDKSDDFDQLITADGMVVVRSPAPSHSKRSSVQSSYSAKKKRSSILRNSISETDSQGNLVSHFSLQPKGRESQLYEADDNIEQEISEMINVIDFSDGESFDTNFDLVDLEQLGEPLEVPGEEKQEKNGVLEDKERPNKSETGIASYHSYVATSTSAAPRMSSIRPAPPVPSLPEHRISYSKHQSLPPRFHSLISDYHTDSSSRPSSMSFRGLKGPAFNSSLKPETRSAILGSLSGVHSLYCPGGRNSVDSTGYESEQTESQQAEYSEPEVDFFAEGIHIEDDDEKATEVHHQVTSGYVREAAEEEQIASRKPRRVSLISRFGSSRSNGSVESSQLQSPAFSTHSFVYHSLGSPATEKTGERLKSRYENEKLSKKKVKKRIGVQFSSRILLYTTYAEDEYDRRPEDAACNNLTPELALEIKNELNEFKAQMDVNEESRCYTHFF